MSTQSHLANWLFLVGEWKGSGKLEQAANHVEPIETIATFTQEMGGTAIMGVFKSTQSGKIINESIGILFYDVLNETFRRKSFFSYGFVNNEVAFASTPQELWFTVESEPIPPQFKDLQWRSYIIKMSPTTIRLGLQQSKKGRDFQLYNETTLEKIS